MSEAKKPSTEMEMANVRNNLNLLRSQLRAGRLDQAFLQRQIDKIDSLLQRLNDDQQQRYRMARHEALYNVSRMLGSSLDLQVVLDQVMDAIIQLTGAERGFLMLHDDDGGFQVKAARNLDQQTLGDEAFQFSRTVVNRVLDSGEAILTTNATTDPRFSGQASVVAQSLRSVMATPLRARGNVLGAVYVDNRALAGLFNEDDLDALDALSSQAAVTLENARLFSDTDEALNKRLEQLRQLRRVDMQLNESLETETTVRLALEWACKLGEADRGMLSLVETNDQGPHFIQSYHFGHPPGDEPDGTVDIIYSAAKDVARAGTPVTDTHPQSGHPIVIVPVSRGQQITAVAVLERLQKQAFGEEQIDLIERVMARAAVAIENSRLYAAVQAADRAKSEFVGIVAHDLKSPMTGIKGYAELLIMFGSLSDEQIDYLRRITNTVQRMQVLVSDLADISRIESGHFYMEMGDISVEDVVRAARDTILLQIQARNHQYVEDIAPDLPPVHTDYYRLLQVLTNLLSNATKYTPDGGTITLKAQQHKDRVRFSVTDTGIGLSAEQISKLGTKFWRANDDFTRSQPGTGLGFSITRSLVEQMGDTITIESSVGKGSTFSFSVPITPLTVDGTAVEKG
ncbi:MAG: ATP-binding protein [Chloroflexota bacterium]